MPLLIDYFIKVSISLAIVYLLYQLLLRKLTFYQWNRGYLVGYTLLSFLIPFIDITPVLERNEMVDNKLFQVIPVVQQYTTGLQPENICPEPVIFSNWSKWDWILLSLLIGAVFMLAKFMVRYLSFRKIRRNASLISNGEMKIYQVDKEIIPFSFGNAIFINQSLHREDELVEIIRHEFVHVKQRHTMDILLGEFLCMVNWYNPFAWLIRHAIRQNLEFIADDKVMQSGIDRKQYQYLLLKVIGNNHFSIANQFNFSSLKKRIAMMNKIKSTNIHLLKFMFLVPLMAVLLLAFRNSGKPATASKPVQETQVSDLPQSFVSIAGLVVDASTKEPLSKARLLCKEKSIDLLTDEKGYYQLKMPADGVPLRFVMQISKEGYHPTSSAENWGISSGKSVEFFGLVKKGSTGEGFGELTGEFAGLNYDQVWTAFNDWKILQEKYRNERTILEKKFDTIPDNKMKVTRSNSPADEFFERNPNVQAYWYQHGPTPYFFLEMKSGVELRFDLRTEVEARSFKKQYGELPLQVQSLLKPVKESFFVATPDSTKLLKTGESTRMIFTADTIYYTSASGTLHLRGEAVLVDNGSELKIKAEGIDMVNQSGQQVVFLDGKEIVPGKDYEGKKGTRFEVKTLSKEEATRKYGDKGKSGVLEITTLD